MGKTKVKVTMEIEVEDIEVIKFSEETKSNILNIKVVEK